MGQVKDHVLYVAKTGQNSFKFGITKNVGKRLGNIRTTGYGNAVLIGESLELVSREEVFDFETFLKSDFLHTKSEWNINTTEARELIKMIKTQFGWTSRASIDVDVQNLQPYSVGQILKLKITPEVICVASKPGKSCGVKTRRFCLGAEALKREGNSSVNFQTNITTFNRGGFRHYCKTYNDACHMLLDFDAGKKMQPQVVTLEVLRVEPIVSKPRKSRTLSQVAAERAKRTKQKNQKRSKRYGRHHGLWTAMKVAA